MARKNSNFNGKSGGAGFFITLGVAYLLFKGVAGSGLAGLIVGAIIGAGVGLVTSIMGSKLDTTTHNKQDVERRKQEELQRMKEEEQKRKEAASQIPLTGDEAADAVIIKGQEMLKTIRTENALIPDETLSAQMDTLAEKCRQIFLTVSDSPAKAPQVRKFMNYYLPTTLKMLANYRKMQESGVSFQEMNQARETAIRGMNMVLTACQKLIDNLHKDSMLDISTDIDVMEQMLKRDGYTENEITGNKGLVMGARTAAEAQMRTSSAPVMDFPDQSGDENQPGAAHKSQTK
ncbi:MAG: 5-bromo-4-chloroindolyl phosphate hydrolysis family protein [Clostridiales bacterium]|nr:5-bromo-4-chloroindolyl phosphate hydrolysis family protein [Clostridiales bacterium]